jgi:hypothetical protein
MTEALVDGESVDVSRDRRGLFSAGWLRRGIMGDRYFGTLARYNEWANTRLYEACARLPDTELKAPRPAFFGSLLGPLNHIWSATACGWAASSARQSACV